MTTETSFIVDPATFAPFSSDSYKKNSPNTEHKGWQACPCCGKAVKNANGTETLYVEVLHVRSDKGFDCGYRATEGKGHSCEVADTQGWFAVGAACARKLRKAGADVRNLEPLA